MKKRIVLLLFLSFSLLYANKTSLEKIILSPDLPPIKLLDVVRADDNILYLLGVEENREFKPAAVVIRYSNNKAEKVWEFSKAGSSVYSIPYLILTDLDGDGNPEILLFLNYLHDKKSKRLPWLFLFEMENGVFPEKPTYTWDYNLSGISYLRPAAATCGNFDLDREMEICIIAGSPERAIFLVDYSSQDDSSPFSFKEKIDFPEITAGIRPMRVLTLLSHGDSPDELVVIGEKRSLNILRYSPSSRKGKIVKYKEFPAGSIDLGSIYVGQVEKEGRKTLAAKTSKGEIVFIPLEENQKVLNLAKETDIPSGIFTLFKRSLFEREHLLIYPKGKPRLYDVYYSPEELIEEGSDFLVDEVSNEFIPPERILSMIPVMEMEGEYGSGVVFSVKSGENLFYLWNAGKEEELALKEILRTTQGAEFGERAEGESPETEDISDYLKSIESFKGDLYQVRETTGKAIFSKMEKPVSPPDKVITPGEKLRISIPVEELQLSEYKKVNLQKDLPPGMKFDPVSGFLTWTPSDSQLGFFYPRIEFQLDTLRTRFSYIIYVNDPPRITSNPPEERIIQIGDKFEYQVTVEDRNSDRQFDYKLRRAPEGAKIDETGKLTWTPMDNQADWYEVVIQVSDSYHTDSQSFDLFVNHPVFIKSKGPDFCRLGDTYEYAPTVEDKNKGFYISFGGHVPKIIEAVKTHIFEYKFSDDQISGNLDKYIDSFRKTVDPYVKTGGEAGKISKSLALIDIFSYEKKLFVVAREEGAYKPRPQDWARNIFQPQLGKVPEYRSREIPLYAFNVVNLPRGARQYPDGRIIWKPDPDQYDTHPIIYTVSDGYTTDSENIQVYVNSPPIIVSRPDSMASVGVYWSYQVETRDNNTDSKISYTLSEAPEGMLIDKNGFITWIPEEDQIGSNRFTVRASDGYESAKQTEMIFVNVPPRFTSEAQPVAVVGFTYTYKINASDPNGDTVVLSAIQIPENSQFDPVSGNFSWLPDETQQGQNILIFQATDSHGASVQQDVSLQVFENPAPKPKGKFGSFFIIGFIGAISLALGVVIGNVLIP